MTTTAVSSFDVLSILSNLFNSWVHSELNSAPDTAKHDYANSALNSNLNVCRIASKRASQES